MFDIARTPADGTSARVIKGGVHYTPDKMITNEHSDCPLPMRSPNHLERHSKTFVDLKGTKFGQFTVVGLHDAGRTKKTLTWVVRCSCGKYETRTSKAVRNPNNAAIDCCQWCRQVDYLRNKDASRNERNDAR